MADYDDVPYIVVEKRSGSLSAFVWGALIGAGLGILFAPRSGRETRREIREGALRMKESAEDSIRQVQQAVSDTLGGVREEIEGRMEAARDAFESGREAARESRAEMERRIREARAAYQAGIDAARAARTPPAEPPATGDREPGH